MLRKAMEKWKCKGMMVEHVADWHIFGIWDISWHIGSSLFSSWDNNTLDGLFSIPTFFHSYVSRTLICGLSSLFFVLFSWEHKVRLYRLELFCGVGYWWGHIEKLAIVALAVSFYRFLEGILLWLWSWGYQCTKVLHRFHWLKLEHRPGHAFFYG